MASLTPSNAAVFATNLRLLDLDNRNDWPSITAQTLSTKDAQQNQKTRIRCVEWALYRLFEIWDPEETKIKPQPFFPPLEPLQSLNLRAALYRALDALKKTGVLSREITLRKTMLDECKGGKFEEVLVAFSTVVLKRKVRDESICAESVVRGLVLGHSIPASWQDSMLPLTIAHRASLASQLRKKKELRSQYTAFGRFLDLKEQEIADRTRQLMEATQYQSEDHVPEKAAQECKEHLKGHWLGDTKWIDTIVRGHPHARDDSIIDTSFNNLWRAVQNGTIANFNTTSDKTLLAKLETRVAGQQARLRRWKRFQEDMRKSAASKGVLRKADVSPSQGQGLGLEFRRHQDLVPKLSHGQGASPTQEAGRSLPIDAITSEYQKLITSMQEELANVGKSESSKGTGWRGESAQAITASKKGVGVEDISALSEVASERDSPPSKNHVLVTERPSTSVSSKIPTMARRIRHRTISINDADHFDTPPKAHDVPFRQESLKIASQSASPEQLVSGHTSVGETEPSVFVLEPSQAQHPNDQPSPQKNEDELLAEQILSSIANAEPSPVKPKLSLAERTRRSMAHISNKDSPSMTPLPMPPPPPLMPESPVLPSPDFEAFDRRASLLERTRQSMSLLPTKPRKSMRKPPPSKLFPTNQFETPKKQQLGMINAVKDLTPPEELFGEEADYASVFKSRPKIGLSPALSPTKLEELPGEVEDMALSGNRDSSPAVRAVGRTGGF
ncbi:HAUS augmin-like complex subunit 6, N-terminal [Lasallia pustulata]|uniref:HAUS augmin-like complex subunit 6, N-terminal n=1 Tax=Lasallia pustulata TaxID=136370 RepID=A0A1W5DCB9_9LECA|nr:HAUS augmin-like complex subunit 6, N-terminal [Lasallia pustulata]